MSDRTSRPSLKVLGGVGAAAVACGGLAYWYFSGGLGKALVSTLQSHTIRAHGFTQHTLTLTLPASSASSSSSSTTTQVVIVPYYLRAEEKRQPRTTATPQNNNSNTNQEPPSKKEEEEEKEEDKKINNNNNTNNNPIVILHGFGMDAASMAAALSPEFLAAVAHRRVILLDLPGHGALVGKVGAGGEAKKEGGGAGSGSGYAVSRHFVVHLLRVLDALLGKGCGFDLVGYSLGGAVATYLARERPEQVGKLLLLAPALPDTIGEGFQAAAIAKPGDYHGYTTAEGIRNFMLHGLSFAPKLVPPTFILRGVARMRNDAAPSPDYWPGYVAAMLADQSKDKAFVETHGDALRQAFARTGTRVMIVTGDKDVICEPGKMWRLQDALGDAVSRNIVVPGYGHYGTDEPDAADFRPPDDNFVRVALRTHGVGFFGGSEQ